MLIRPYAPDDFKAIVALWDATGISIQYNDPAKDVPRMLAAHDCQLYVGTLDDRIVGSIMVGHEGHRGWLYKLAVMPEHRGKGYGRDLVRHAERWLVARGMPKCNLMIRETNTAVRDFYERLGYLVADRTVMQRWLTPAEIDMRPAELEEITICLEMKARPTRPTVPLPAGQYAVMRLEKPSVAFYRYLYKRVGEPWMWIGRTKLSDAALAAEITAEGVEIYVLYASGEPAGFVELDRRPKPEIYIAHFGLAPEYIGRGLGRYFLNWAVDQAWSYGPERVTVRTWSFDHPRALVNYQKAGFRPYKQVRDRLLDPRLEGLIPAEVQPRTLGGMPHE